MASRIWDGIAGLVKRQRFITGSVRPAGTGTPTNQTGRGFAVTRVAAGKLRVTLTDAYPELVAAIASVRETAGVDTLVTIGAYSATNKTLDIYIKQPSTGTIPLPLTNLREIATNDFINAAGVGGILCSDTTPLLQRTNAATDKAARVVWAAGNSDEVQWAGIPYPDDLDDTAAMQVNLWLEKSANTDTTATVAVSFWEGKGDTNAGGNTSALSTATLAKRSVSIAASDVLLTGGFFNVGVTPGTHASDDIRLYAASVTYTRILYANTDLSADADRVLNFLLAFRNSSINVST